jgi:hypothetical protein
MDQVLSSIIPTQQIGNDGFNWWVGQVEGTAADEPNNKGGTRYKVRIVGVHPQSFELLPTADLPWANVMMPVTVPFMPGNEGGASSQLKPGCWVVGFYLDPERQKPLIMGSIGQTPGATTIVKNARPDDLPFTTAIPSTVNPAKDGTPAPENPSGGQSTETNKSTGGMPDGTKGADGKPRIPVAAAPADGDREENWCQSVAEKCDKDDLQTQTTTIISELLGEIQNNGGNIGDYLINKYTGGLYSITETARKYTNKMMFVVQHFLAKIKGFIIEKLENAVKDLINALLYPSEKGNVLTPVTEFFNKLLKNVGCQMADLGDRLADWLTNVLMDLVTQIYQAAICQIDTLVNGILSKINSLIEDVLNDILGPIQDILGAIAAPLNILGGALNYVTNLLGISCSGPDQTCAEYKKVCTNGSKKESNENKDFLDGLISGIDNLFPATGADYTSYTCQDAYTGKTLQFTTIGFTGGVPKPNGSGSNSEKPKILYTIDDIEVEEGKDAVFTVTRSGYTQIASSVSYQSLENQGTATSGSDYYPSADILGFAPNETTKKITFKTFYNVGRENDETFFVSLKLNSPERESGVSTLFSKNIGKCVITERNKTEKSPYNANAVNPVDGIDSVFSDVDTPTTPTNTGDPSQKGSKVSPSYSVVADKTSVKEGEFVVYTITTSNVDNGTIAYYTLSGVSNNDIIGGSLKGSFVVDNGAAKVTVGIEEDDEPENYETLTFTINGTGATTSVLIVPDQNKTGGGTTLQDYDSGVGNGPETVYKKFVYPTVDPKKIITDNNGGIIEIPIDNPGSPWSEPPFVFIGGEGIGATATALLDDNGYLTEIRVKSSGYGYKKNVAIDNGVRCVIDSFTIIRPGIAYTNTPQMYVDGELGVAEPIINDDGFVIGGRVLDRSRTYDKYPEIIIVGGGGYGAKVLPSLVCLDTEALSTIGSTKIGTGRYVDCP